MLDDDKRQLERCAKYESKEGKEAKEDVLVPGGPSTSVPEQPGESPLPGLFLF